MLKGCSGLAAFALILASAPADAREPAKRGETKRGEAKRAKARSHLPQQVGTRNFALSGIARAPRQRQAAPIPDPVDGFADGLLRREGAPGSENNILRSLPVGPVEAGVGLFSVTGATVKERELKRTDPIADVAPRRSRVAAVGLRMSF